MKIKIHVNQHNIRANHKHGTDKPVFTVKDYKQNRKGNSVLLRDDAGNVVAELVYRPDAPLPCGARCWIETELEVEVV